MTAKHGDEHEQGALQDQILKTGNGCLKLTSPALSKTPLKNHFLTQHFTLFHCVRMRDVEGSSLMVFLAQLGDALDEVRTRDVSAELALSEIQGAPPVV